MELKILIISKIDISRPPVSRYETLCRSHNDRLCVSEILVMRGVGGIRIMDLV